MVAIPRDLHFLYAPLLLLPFRCRWYSKVAGDIGFDTIGAWVIFVAFDLSLKASQTGKGLLSLLSLDRRNGSGRIGQEHRETG